MLKKLLAKFWRKRKAGPPRIIVLIPTRNRESKHLNATLLSVAQQAILHKHRVEIVVSDSSGKNYADKNKSAVENLSKRFRNIPIHYYPLENSNPIDEVLAQASSKEKKAFEGLVPADGHWGANRNRLALLGVFHGGENAVYLHLDDDTPLLKLGEPDWKVEKSKDDIIGDFLKGLEKAHKHGKKGFAGWITGVPGGIVSFEENYSREWLDKYRKMPTLMQKLFNIRAYTSGAYGYGPGRILSYRGMQLPYAPYGGNEDDLHSRMLGGLAFNYHPFETSARVVHLGWSGFSPTKKIESAKSDRVKQYQKVWSSLVRRMAKLAEKENK